MIDAGLDWSGTPDAPTGETEHELYIACTVRCHDREILEAMFREWRREFRLRPDHEFHGYQLRRRTDVFLRFVETAVTDAQVFALEYDKRMLEEQMGRHIYDKPAYIAPATGLLLTEYVFTGGELKTLTYDAGDIAEENRRKQFHTAVQRTAKQMGFASPAVRPRPSEVSCHVQFADMIAYALRRDAEGLTETQDLRRALQKLRRKSECMIAWGSGDDLRPYLSL